MWTAGRQSLFLPNSNENCPLISQEIIAIDPECNQQCKSRWHYFCLEINNAESELNSWCFIQSLISVSRFKGKRIVYRSDKQSSQIPDRFLHQVVEWQGGLAVPKPTCACSGTWHKKCRLTIYKSRTGIDFIETVQWASGHMTWGDKRIPFRHWKNILVFLDDIK